MASNYQQYGGNPYASTGNGGSGTTNNEPQPPLEHYRHGPSAIYPEPSGGSGYGASNPYGSDSYGAQGDASGRPQPHEQTSTYTQNSNYQNPADAPPLPGSGQTSTVLSNQDFLARVEETRSDIRHLTGNVAEIGTIHQRILGSPDSSASAQLDNLVSQTQILNTRIKDQIKFLEADAAKDARTKRNTTKDSQIRTLKQSFKSQLEDFQKEETTYRQRYQEQIARQYRIVNPDASESEVREAAEANWGDEGVFQTALKSNRTGAASSVLGSVRARHNDIQKIEKTLIELNELFQQLGEQVILQEPAIEQTEVAATNVQKDTEAGNKELDKGIKSARNARKLKWYCFFIVLLIIAILALVLGLYFGLHNN